MTNEDINDNIIIIPPSKEDSNIRGKHRTLDEHSALRSINPPLIMDDSDEGGIVAIYPDGRKKPLTRQQFAQHTRDIEAQITERTTGVRP